MNLSSQTMYQALCNRDPQFEGLFFVGVITTGIFCRPTCTARKPKFGNVEFFANAKAAMFRGYRPCKICHPLRPAKSYPDWMESLMKRVENDRTARFKDFELREMGVDPNRMRRWFKKNFKMTFQGYLRSQRMGEAFGRLKQGGKVIDAAFSHGYDSLSGFTEAFKNLTGVSPRECQSKEVIRVYQITTPLGPMIVGSVKEGICLLEFTDRRMLETQVKILQKRMSAPLVTGQDKHIKKLMVQLSEYFEGKRTDFDVPLAIPGTEFQLKVWDNLRKIPYGETRSYGEQAKSINNPKAVRAVAKTNGDNRIAIVIPCHRVIGSDGKLVGYAGGIWRKQFLLDLEQKNRITLGYSCLVGVRL